ncbi:MAG: cell division protein ZapA [Rickettsiales bacterium]|nr:cell division protein ZapA [Rickettsiales bacterium]
MTKLDISISSIKYTIECNDDEVESFKEIAKSLNKKTNEIMMNTGKISDRLILFILLLINTNKEQKIFNNFETNILKLLKTVAPLLNNNEGLDNQLIISNLIKESQTSNIKEEKIPEVQDENIQKLLAETKKDNDETLKLMEEIIKFIEKLAKNINNM